MGTEVSIAVLRSESQKEISLKIDQLNNKKFIEAIAQLDSTREQARISSLSLPYAGAWLNVDRPPVPWKEVL